MKITETIETINKNQTFIFSIGIATLLSYLTNVRELFATWLARIGIDNPVAVELLFPIAACGLFAFLLTLARRVFSQSVTLLNYHDNVGITFCGGGSGERIHEFQTLRSKARKSIFVMGVGMTYFSSDILMLKALLDKGISVRLLMVDPEIVVSWDGETMVKNTSAAIDPSLFDEYFQRSCYTSDIASSLARLQSFIATRKRNTDRKGRIELRVYRLFIPINFTIIDERDEGEMLFETIMPFSENRMRARILQKRQRAIFDGILGSCEYLWQMSSEVDRDFK